jgi:hypothetical protein
VLYTVDKEDACRFVDFVDHSELPPASRVQSFQLSPERLAGPLGILGDRAKDCLEDCGSDLLGQSVEVPDTLRRDLNLIGHLQLILEAEPLSFCRLSTRFLDRVEKGPILEDVDGLL